MYFWSLSQWATLYTVLTDLVLRVPVDVPEEDCAVESGGGEVLLPPGVLDVLHPVHVAVQGTHLVLQVPVIHTTSSLSRRSSIINGPGWGVS